MGSGQKFAPDSAILGKVYQYDQLNRIREAMTFTNYSTTNNTWENTPPPPGELNFKTSYTYDANGNILTLNRYAGEDEEMDDLEYFYKTGTNQLTHVTDQVADNKFDYDIDNQQANNYTYDKIGNLISDVAEEIESIEWTVYGKIKSIIRTANSEKPNLSFEYSPDGHRVAKHVTNSEGQTSSTYYIRDASGNVMATYDRVWDVEYDESQVTVMDIYDYLENNTTILQRLNFLNETIDWSQYMTSGDMSDIDQEIINANKVRDLINYFSPHNLLDIGTWSGVYNNAINATEAIEALRGISFTDDQIVEYLCSQCMEDIATALMIEDYSAFLNHLYAYDQGAFIHLRNILMIDPGLPLQDQINQIISSSSASNSAQNLQPLQCQALGTIYAQMFTSGSTASLNFLLSIPGIKNCKYRHLITH